MPESPRTPPLDAPRPWVFVAEGDRLVRREMEAACRELGYRFEGFTRFADLQRRLSQQVPDVLVVAGLLPDGSGLDFLEGFLFLFETGLRRPGVIFHSALFRTFAHQRRLKDLGVDRVLPTPCPPETFRRAVADLAEGAEAGELGRARLAKASSGPVGHWRVG